MSLQPATTVFYHADCLDGFGAAYAAWRRFGADADYRPMHYGNDWTPADVAHRDVYVLDFSFPPAVLKEIARRARSVTQIDHHASARADWAPQLAAAAGSSLARHAEGALAVLFDLDKSGARLAWEFFHPGTPVPAALLHVEDQDLWRFRLPGTRAFCRALRLRPFDFAEWQRLVDVAEAPEAAPFRALLVEGEAIERFLAIEVSRLAASGLVGTVRLPQPGDPGAAPVEGLAINANAVFASDLGGALAERSGTFGLIWHLDADGWVKASLRGCNRLDMAALARQFGGGGHPNAAGFRLPWPRFAQDVLRLPAMPDTPADTPAR